MRDACPCSSGGQSSGFLNRVRRFESGQGYHAGRKDSRRFRPRSDYTTWTPSPPSIERTFSGCGRPFSFTPSLTACRLTPSV